jgi:hypothetical protein
LGLARAALKTFARQQRVYCRSTDFLPASLNAQQQQQQQQQRLDASGIGHLVRCTHSLLQLLGSADGLSVQELLDGVINVVYAGGLEQ